MTKLTDTDTHDPDDSGVSLGTAEAEPTFTTRSITVREAEALRRKPGTVFWVSVSLIALLGICIVMELQRDERFTGIKPATRQDVENVVAQQMEEEVK